MKSELLQIRVPAELKEQLKAKGPISAYVRGLIKKDLGGDARERTSSTDEAAGREPPVRGESQGGTDPQPPVGLSALEITALARKRWPHLPLVVAEKKVKAET